MVNMLALQWQCLLITQLLNGNDAEMDIKTTTATSDAADNTTHLHLMMTILCKGSLILKTHVRPRLGCNQMKIWHEIDMYNVCQTDYKGL